MISPSSFYDALRRNGIGRFAGVPDSLLKELCAFITDNVGKEDHIITANEGNAIALATGWYLGSGKPCLVYMQNSGLGNAINPLASLSDPEVYGIPMLLVIGWRGEPGVKDEPQHIKQGRVTTTLLGAMEIPYIVIGPGSDPEREVSSICSIMLKRCGPAAIMVKEGTFSPYPTKRKASRPYEMGREEAIKTIIDALGPSDIVVSTTGKASRELYEHRLSKGKGSENDFLTVGSMGHASSIAMGLAYVRSERRVICLDGDGAMIMHMGAMAVIGNDGPRNMVHIVLNNGSHDSVGGQPTVGFNIDMVGIAKGCGYRNAFSVTTAKELVRALNVAKDGPLFIEVKVNGGARQDLGRPKGTPAENRERLMRNLLKGDGNA